MQGSGTLKKRTRRNLTKVSGLSTIAYNDFEDSYDGRALFNIIPSSPNGPDNYISGHTPFIKMANGATTLQMNSALFRSSRPLRVTRNPDFHTHILSSEADTELDLITPATRITSAASFADDQKHHDRPHFLDKTSMNRLKLLVLLGILSGGFPWKWDGKTSRIKKWSPTLQSIWKPFYLFLLIQTVFLTLFQIYSFLHQFNSGAHATYRETFMSSFSVCWYMYAVYYNINLIFYRDKIRNYINTLLNFNEECVQKYLIHLDGIEDGGRVIMNVAIPCNTFQIFCSVFLFLVMPYQPWYLFSYIYPKPWYWLIPGAIQEFVVVANCISSYLLVSWIVVAHCNTVQFWLGEIHNHNDSDYTTDELRQPKTAVETFKSLQVLCNLFNECMAPLAVPLTKVTVFTALIPCGYVLIRSMNHLFIEEFPGILTYPMGVVDCATVGFAILTMGAQMHDMATSFCASWNQTKHKGFRRLLMSLPSLKIRIGRLYFVTVSTTITFFQVIFDLITDAIIACP